LLSFRAYAKINLGLQVLEKRPDGYHDIATIFHRVELSDEITLTQSDEIVVESSSVDAPSDQRNICYKAVDLLRQRIEIDKGANISIQKNIPVGAGLGGGSSDAASVLLHLPAFWGMNVSPGVLKSVAQELGSDVSYFMQPGSALGRSRGEELEYFELDVPFSILLCNPLIHVSTAWAYQHVRPRSKPVNLKEIVLEGMKERTKLLELENDIEEGVFAEYPEIKTVKEMLIDGGAIFSLMSGSGSTVYGLFDEPSKMEGAASMLKGKGYRTHVTPPHFNPSVT